MVQVEGNLKKKAELVLWEEGSERKIKINQEGILRYGRGTGNAKTLSASGGTLVGECMKCVKNPQGLKTLAKGGSGGTPEVESALERARRIGERGETARRHPKVLVLTINLLIDDKPNRRPQLEDHYVIMKQAGLNLAEVKGKVAKNGYLEVALQPGAASAAGALHEVSKIVDNRITILSVREGFKKKNH